MAAWSTDNLNQVGAADEVRLAARRDDDTWIVRVGEDLYLRSVNGGDTGFCDVQGRHESRLQARALQRWH
jgi:hypothetical protein